MKKILALMLLSLSLSAHTFNVSTTTELRTALNTAATNGEDDTIILANGTYKTTDDGYGTFIYSSDENNSLTLQGSSSKNVILSGDSKNQILKHTSTEHAPLKLEKLTFMDGNNTAGDGGGVSTDYNIDILDCNFTNNSADSHGGGFNSDFATSVTNSTFTNNNAGDGGGFNSDSATSVTNSTFTNNNANSGSGFNSNYTTRVTNSTFTNNSANRGGGGGFYSDSTTTVTNSIFTNNSANHGGGGAGFYSNYTTRVTNSTFTNNSADNNGGGFNSGSTTVKNSTFTNNSANRGGGFDSNSVTITNSTFTNNIASNGGGFYSDSTTVTNSIFTNNSANHGGGFDSSSTTVTNSLLASNNSGIYIRNDENNKIYNTIFLDNNNSDIDGGSNTIISNLENNYINVFDTSKITVQAVKKNNIFSGVTLGFVDAINGNYHLTANSDLINAGTTTVATDVTLPTTDLDGNARVVGGSIDIGPYEFSSTKPTINSLSYTGVAKEMQQLTFSVAYTLSSGRTVSSVSYDYTNSGSWSSSNTHTFDTAGTYTVKVKVTDDAGEFSTRSLSVTIAPITLKDKLLTVLTQDEVDAILPIINADKSATTTGTDSSIALTSEKITNLSTGWTLASTPFTITDMSIFDSASIIWTYNHDTSSWSAYSSNTAMKQAITNKSGVTLLTTIPAGSGIWVDK